MNRFGNKLFCIIACALTLETVLPNRVAALGNENILWSVDWSPDDKRFAVGGAWVGVFNAKTLERVRTPALDSIMVNAKVRWHPSRNLLAFSGREKPEFTGVYDPAIDRKIILKTKEGTRGICWNSTGELLATAGNGGELQIWKADGELLHTVRPEKAKGLTGVAWHPKENIVVTVGEFIRWHDGSGNITRQISPRPQAKGMVLLLCVEWHPSGEFFVVGDYGNAEAGDAPALQFWSADGKLLKTIEIAKGAEFRDVSWTRDGNLLASASDSLRIWSKEGELQHAGKSPDNLWGVRWDRKAKRILTSSQNGRVTLWSARAEVVKQVVEGPVEKNL